MLQWLRTTSWIGRGVCVAVLSAPSVAWAQGEAAPASQETKALNFQGDSALWSLAIRPDQTAAFEQVMVRLGEALKKSDNPVRRQQAAGWTIVRLTTPLPDGAIVYVHVIHPVVHGANYSVMQVLYDEFPEERRALYDLYRGAFDRNLSLATGVVAVNLNEESPESSVTVGRAD